MTVEIRPLGVACNLQCRYCYQAGQRGAHNLNGAYDLDAIRRAVEAEGCEHFSLFGGEALLLPLPDLEEIWAWGLECYGRNGVQTNGTLITEAHYRLFHEYKVHVGLSMDGPEELNDIRWAGGPKRTRQMTARSQEALERLCAEGLSPSLIVTLHRCNASAERLPRLLDWMRRLEKVGVTSARLHLLEVDSRLVQSEYSLSVEENLAALRAFNILEKELVKLRFDLFSDIRNLLHGRDQRVTCIWNACDPYTTRAVRGVEGTGQISNCGRTNKDGVDFVKADQPGYERALALYHTPQEFGGCQGCRYFIMCKGSCPGTALEGDWRNRSEQCQVWSGIFSDLEIEMLASGETPLSQHPQRERLEKMLIEAWARGQFLGLNQALCDLHHPERKTAPSHLGKNGHGDHTDARRKTQLANSARGNGHGDHGDHHDHMDGRQGG